MVVYRLSNLVEKSNIKYSRKVATQAAFWVQKWKMMNSSQMIIFFFVIVWSKQHRFGENMSFHLNGAALLWILVF
jgi:archaellum biogenesis protein FlaJ (TadC family)